MDCLNSKHKMKTKLVNKRYLIPIIVFSFIMTAFGHSFALNPENWEANLEITISTVQNRLSFGQKTDATEGRDNLYDVPAMPGGEMYAYFFLEKGSFWRDIRGFSQDSISWIVVVKSSIKEKKVTIKWDPEKILAAKISLHDLTTDKVINMKNSNSYSYINDGEREIKLVLGPAK